MNQRAVIREIWERRKRTLAPSPQAQKAEAFFQFVDEHTDMCWEELAEEFRENYADAAEIVVSVLLETDDPLIVYNCIRFADQSRAPEIAAMKRIAHDCDLERHQVGLVALAKTQAKEVTTILRARKELPSAVRTALKAPGAAPAVRKKKASDQKDQ
jgi:hypothetical protein